MPPTATKQRMMAQTERSQMVMARRDGLRSSCSGFRVQWAVGGGPKSENEAFFPGIQYLVNIILYITPHIRFILFPMLLTKTTELAIQCLVFMSEQPDGTRINPATISTKCSESETYIAKVMRTLAKAGMLRSHRGITGGYEAARPADQITLLDVVEACQGTIPGNYCHEVDSQELRNTCGYHQAMQQLRTGVVDILSEWTIARVATAPRPATGVAPKCRLNCLNQH